MTEDTVGSRIKRFRTERGLSATELANQAGISRSYLSELESKTGSHKKPSADVLYAIGKTLGVAMSDLLGRPIITGPTTERNDSLTEFAQIHDLPESDVEMLASIEFRGQKPRSLERWEFIYQAIKNSKAMDP